MASIQLGPSYLYADGVIWPIICTAVVAARFGVRRTQGNRYGLDDWLMIPALMCVWGLGAALIATTALGATGVRTPVSAPDQALVATSREQTITKKLYIIFVVVQTAGLGFIKISCLAFYRRIFRTGTNKIVDAILLFLMGTVVVWMVSFCFAFPFMCRTHFDYLWSNLVNLAKCPTNTIAVNYGLAISDVVMDFLILLFPIPFVWQLHMSVGRKLAVTGVFVLGSLSIAASIFRLVVLSEDLQAEFQKEVDQDLITGGQCWLMLIEAGFALCAICLPSLSPAFNVKTIRSFFNSISNVFSLHSRGSGHRSASSMHGSNEVLPSDLAKVESSSRADSAHQTYDQIELEPLPHETRRNIIETSDSTGYAHAV